MQTISSDLARQWWRALMDNVVQLLRDASTLLASGSAGRAQSLAVLAAEELGKAWRLYSAAEVSWRDDRPETRLPADFVSSAKHHASKLADAAAYGQGGSMMWDYWFARYREQSKSSKQLQQEAKNYNLMKQAGFYVDLRNGVVESPRSVGDDGVLSFILEIVQAANMLFVEDHVRMQNSGEDPDWTHEIWEPLIQLGRPKDGFHKPADVLGGRKDGGEL
ncbi:AbiV family abortive infection protein [Sinomonas sp. P10A9]|uniref:AbiV family abortive infection protein n=1 Tax=Sinomonas puerhi TaxID=3238584 RepID=A0AB39KZY2_9MICC